MMANVYAAWIGFLAGCLAGVVAGLFFHDDNFLGGYSSWQRRLIRLAHVSFFGIGLFNLAFALTARALGIESGLNVVSVLLVIGAVSMPLVSYLAAYRKPFRQLFFIPVLSVTGGITLFLWKVLSL